MRASNSHVDLGSSSIEREDASFTMRNDVWRNGTPEYAAPEMLTRDVPGVAELRRSPSVDAYALCSVLYEMYSGRTPFDVASSPLASPYALKTEGEPAPLEPACPEDEPLVEAITAGIHARQEEREDAAELLGRLHAWRRGEKYEPDRAPEPSEFARAVAKGDASLDGGEAGRGRRGRRAAGGRGQRRGQRRRRRRVRSRSCERAAGQVKMTKRDSPFSSFWGGRGCPVAHRSIRARPMLVTAGFALLPRSAPTLFRRCRCAAR